MLFSNQDVSRQEARQIWMLVGVLLFILCLRCFSLGWLALSDPTEARYADVSLQMLQTGQWITPEIIIANHPVPYWGKPPLHFWLTAISFTLFGISEWSARFPSFLAGIVILAMLYFFAARLYGVRKALIACIILSSSGLFFILTGASVVDVTLSATVTGAMTSFALTAMSDRKTLWGHCFFVFLGLAMLAKGPVALLLVAIAIGGWLLLTRNWHLLKKLPWKIGTIVFVGISVPWYVAEEIRSPGFLRYFFVNEHLLRYVVHDYGDKYGSGHVYPRGSIWVMLAFTFLPWSGSLFYLLWKNRTKLLSNRWPLYLTAWGFAPAVLFTFARQVLATYLLPGFAGLALLLVSELSLQQFTKSVRLVLNVQAMFVLLLLLAAVVAGSLYHLPLLLIGGTTVLVAVSFVLCRLFLSNSIPAAVTLTAVGCALLFTGSAFDFRRAIDEKDSAKQVMTYFSKAPRYSHDQVRFPFGVPYSAFFYEKALRHSETLLDRQRSVDPEEDEIFVFTRVQWKQLILPLRRHFQPVYKTAHWIACRERGKNKVPL